MKIILGKVGSGKTYNLLKDCNEKKGVVVVFDNYQRNFCEHSIKEWGFSDIKKVITFDSLLTMHGKEMESINLFFEMDSFFGGFWNNSTISFTPEELSVVKRVIREDGSSDFTRENISLE